jgi:hypothetical protein
VQRAPTGATRTTATAGRAIRFYERPVEDGVAVMDGSEYWATMVTGPHFGCVNHEPDPR